MRHANNFHSFTCTCKTEKYKTSLLPSSVALWNSVPQDLKVAPTLSVFKQRINNLYIPSKPPPYFGQGPRTASVYHTRLRLGHNRLNSHLYNIAVAASPSCNCGHSREDELHYMLVCPLHAAPRARLTESISALVHPLINFNDIQARRPKEALSILLSGLNELSTDINSKIFAAVIAYISSTGRFSLY